MGPKIAGKRTGRGWHILLIEEGSGLCIPRGIFLALVEARDNQLERGEVKDWGDEWGRGKSWSR